MRGFVSIERGPLRFTVQIDKPLSREQLQSLEPIAREMEALEPLFCTPGNGRPSND